MAYLGTHEYHKYCSGCGRILNNRAVICPSCGVSQGYYSRRSKTTAAVLAFFLGGIGIHRFYLGQAGLGFLYLLFCWTFIPALVALFDFLAFIIQSDERFDRKYN